MRPGFSTASAAHTTPTSLLSTPHPQTFPTRKFSLRPKVCRGWRVKRTLSTNTCLDFFLQHWETICSCMVLFIQHAMLEEPSTRTLQDESMYSSFRLPMQQYDSWLHRCKTHKKSACINKGLKCFFNLHSRYCMRANIYKMHHEHHDGYKYLHVVMRHLKRMLDWIRGENS
jgi:hypothetical protein